MEESKKDFTIIKANLNLRFQPHFGWTRKKVASLMKNPDVSFVIPRYYDDEKDKYIRMRSHHGDCLPQEMNDMDFPDCDYYAIYTLSSSQDIDMEKVNHHPII